MRTYPTTNWAWRARAWAQSSRPPTHPSIVRWSFSKLGASGIPPDLDLGVASGQGGDMGDRTPSPSADADPLPCAQSLFDIPQSYPLTAIWDEDAVGVLVWKLESPPGQRPVSWTTRRCVRCVEPRRGIRGTV